MSKPFYLSTAIAYTSSKPHIGNVYEAILADSICRFKRKQGYDVYFQTGTDEHGQKIEQKAKEHGVEPQKWVDEVANSIKETYKLVNVSYDKFVRTTDKEHETEVAKAFEKLLKKGDIYKGNYEGWYCVSCESFFTEKDLVDGCCPDCGSKVTKEKEETYFLRLAPYQARLVEYIKTHPDFIQPESRKNEMLNNFLKDPLPDLCVSRTSYSWGIKVPSDPKHVIYVWIDALMNYITGIGYHVDGPSEEKFNKYWPCDIHLIGKDILRFHTIYWPIILMALDLPLPKQVFGHPWILMNHGKMSKSKGNVIYTDDLVNIFGVDAVRYYVLHEIPFAQDGNITYELVCERNNTELANIYGNLVNRTIAMVNKYFGGSVSYVEPTLMITKNLISAMAEAKDAYFKHMEELKVSQAIDDVFALLRKANKYIDDSEPWALAKAEEKKQELAEVLYTLLEAIRMASIMLENIMPSTATKVYSFLNTKAYNYTDLDYATVKDYTLGKSEVLFQRLDVEKDVLAKVLAKEATPAPAATLENLISIEDFDKVELVVGEILDAKCHPDAKKLLVLEVNIGTEVRQIVSGIREFYQPEELIGKKVCVVKNLKPVKLRGVLSQGMICCAGDKAILVTIPEANAGDKIC